MPHPATPPPDPGARSGLLASLSFIGGLVAANGLADSPYPRPESSPSQLRQYFTQNAGPTRLSAAGQVISAASLARFTASVARLAGRAGPGSRTLQAAAVAGGALAAASLAASAAMHGALSGPAGRREASAIALTRREFLAGGVIHTPAFGVLVGVLGLAGLRTGELPRPVAITALASASTCLLAPLYFAAEPFAWFIPAGRFPGLIVSGIAGVQLARGGRPAAWGQIPDMGLATQRVVYSASGRHLRRPPLDPLHNLRAAVNRRLPGGRQLQPEQALTPSEAVRAHTVTAAAPLGAPGAGGLAPGQPADLVTCDGDPFQPDTQAVQTWIAGQPVGPAHPSQAVRHDSRRNHTPSAIPPSAAGLMHDSRPSRRCRTGYRAPSGDVSDMNGYQSKRAEQRQRDRGRSSTCPSLS